VAHPHTQNSTPFLFEALHLIDEECRPLIVPISKATFRIDGDRCELAEQQVPLQLGGECFGPDPATSSYRYEPEVAFFKPATDVVLIGHAHAVAPGTREMLVDARVGELQKQLHVVGDRVWFKSAGLPTMSAPLAFDRMPLIYERAFGGWDRSDPDPERHAVELRNPVGTGFRAGGFEDGLRLPNLEDPRARIRTPGDRPAPVGIGFTAPHWHPRSSLAGTYDARWVEERSPLLPADFNRSHFNAASAGLVANGYLRGDERVSVTGMTSTGRLEFSLPGVPAPRVRLVLQGHEDVQVPLALDTVIIEPDDRRVMLIWRGHHRLTTGPHDVTEIVVTH
jgi:hypothetical protein